MTIPGVDIAPYLFRISANEIQTEYDAGQKLFQSLNREIVPEHPNIDGSTIYINKPIPFSTLLHSPYYISQPSRSSSAFSNPFSTTMAPAKLENEDHTRDAAFNKAMHKDSANAQGGFSAMMKKDKAAQKAAVDEYFKHWDNKAAKDETPEIREVCKFLPSRCAAY